MKDRAIIFGADSVRAILAGRKTQTRRVVKLPEIVTPEDNDWATVGAGRRTNGEWCAWLKEYEEEGSATLVCSHGMRGDRLWVREAWGFIASVPTTAHEQAIRDRLMYPYGGYRADIDASKSVETQWCWRSPIHMPRWASRITLGITDVRVQRLQEISEEDAKAEGVEPYRPTDGDGGAKEGPAWYRINFNDRWDAINGKRAPWSSNPWVWAISFRPLAPSAGVGGAGSAGEVKA